MKSTIITLSIICCFAYATEERRKVPRIAIIGGGIGGTTTAYKLSKLSQYDYYHIDIDLYEAGEIGGRLATTKVNGREFETGGSVIHERNKLMTYFVNHLGLSWYKEPSWAMKPVTGFYNGNEFVFISSRFTVLNLVRLLWRYGQDILRLEWEIVSPMLSHFERIYEAQENGTSFDDVISMLAYMNKKFPDYLKVGFRDYLKSKRFSDRIIDEIMYMATNVNYNQNTDIHFFVGSVSLAGAEPGSLKSVSGGNKRVPEALLYSSEARHKKATVESIILKPDSTFALETNNETIDYDYVVIACPLEYSTNNIKFIGFKDLGLPFFKFQKTVATIVHGELNHTFFGYETSRGMPNEIFSINDDLFFNCVCMITPVTYDEHYDNKVFKVFSKQELTQRELDLLFLSQHSITVIPWLAYPLYDTSNRKLPLVLYKNLFYLNSIEWAASAMEMSAISGVNVALHIHHKITKKNKSNDE